VGEREEVPGVGHRAEMGAGDPRGEGLSPGSRDERVGAALPDGDRAAAPGRATASL